MAQGVVLMLQWKCYTNNGVAWIKCPVYDALMHFNTVYVWSILKQYTCQYSAQDFLLIIMIETRLIMKMLLLFFFVT